MASSGNDFDAAWTFLLLYKWLQLVQWANFVEFARYKQFWQFVWPGKSGTRGSIERQADCYNGADTWVKRCVGEGHIRAKGMPYKAQLGWIRARLSECAIDGSCDVQWLHASISLGTLTLTNPAIVEA